MLTPSLTMGRFVDWHTHYPVVLIAIIRYLPEICSQKWSGGGLQEGKPGLRSPGFPDSNRFLRARIVPG